MDNLDNSYEPMDIDLSGNSHNAMDISFDKSADVLNSYLDVDSSPSPPPIADKDLRLPTNTTQQSTTIKKFHLIKHKQTISYHTTKKLKIVFAVVTIILSVITYQIVNIQCSNSINPDALKTSISAKLYGQSRAIDSLIEALKVGEKSKILLFYGGTGVGKTFTASLVLEHVGRYSNVYHYTMPSFMDTFRTDFMIGLTVCKHTTVIVDDLSAKDIKIETHIKDLITKSQSLDKEITVILIYNYCDNVAKDFEKQCDESLPDKLLHNFKYIDAFKKLIKFEPLREEHLWKCIEAELENRKLSNIEYEKILKNFDVSLDGCKGVYTKMKFLEIS